MRWDHLDLDAAELTITGSAATIGAVRVEGTTKGGRSRVVSLDAGTVEVVRAPEGADRRAACGPHLVAGR
jgi:integrase